MGMWQDDNRHGDGIAIDVVSFHCSFQERSTWVCGKMTIAMATGSLSPWMECTLRETFSITNSL